MNRSTVQFVERILRRFVLNNSILSVYSNYEFLGNFMLKKLKSHKKHV